MVSLRAGPFVLSRRLASGPLAGGPRRLYPDSFAPALARAPGWWRLAYRLGFKLGGGAPFLVEIRVHVQLLSAMDAGRGAGHSAGRG